MPTIASSSALSNIPSTTAAGPSDYSAAQFSGACALLAILAKAQATTQNGARVDVELNMEKLKELQQQLADEIQKAKDASDNSGFFGFLGDIFGSDIAEVAGAIAAAAAVVATGGAATPVIMIALAEGLQLGAKAGAELGLSPELCAALSLASVAVGLCVGTGELQATSTMDQFAHGLELAANITQGVSTATGAVYQYGADRYHATALRDQASATLCQAGEDTTNLDFDDAVSQLQRSLKTRQHEVDTASRMLRDNSDTNTALSYRI